MTKHGLLTGAFTVVMSALVARIAVPAADAHLFIGCVGVGVVLWLISLFKEDKTGAEVMSVLTQALYDVKQNPGAVVNAAFDSVKRERDELRKNVDYLKQCHMSNERLLDVERIRRARLTKGAADANRAVRRYKDKLDRVKATAAKYRDLIIEMAATMDVHTMFWPPLVDKVLEVVEYKTRRKENASAATKLVESRIAALEAGHPVSVARCASGRCCRNRPAPTDS